MKRTHGAFFSRLLLHARSHLTDRIHINSLVNWEQLNVSNPVSALVLRWRELRHHQ